MSLSLDVLAMLTVGCSGSDPELVRCGPQAIEAGIFDRVETACEVLIDPDNPFDPDEIAVVGEVEGPDGLVREIPGFWTQPYDRALEDGVEVLTAAGAPGFRVRFTPDAEGPWRWRWRVEEASRTDRSEWQEVTVSAAAPDRHGFVRRSSDDPRYLRFDDGTPYFAVGENLAWYDGRGTFAYDAWLEALAAQGATYARLWMPSWGFGLEAIERDAGGAIVSSTLGDYSDRLDRAWQLDHVIDRAGELGIHLMLSLLNHGAWSTTNNAEWSENPYNDDNGGPLSQPLEFFEDAEAQALFERRLRYVVGRWGYTPQIMAWELWNEVDLTLPTDVPAVLEWHRRMASLLRELDPHDHLVSTSTAQLTARLIGLEEPLDALEELDFVQIHHYGSEITSPDFTIELPERVAELAPFGKPILAAEVGVDYRSAEDSMLRDPEGAGLHDLIWSGVFAETFGTGMTWWWDEIVEPQGWVHHLGPVAELTAGVEFDREGFRTDGATVSSDQAELGVMALVGRETALVWIKNRGNLYFASLDDSPIDDAQLELAGLTDGTHEAHWIDAYGAQSLASSEVTVAGGIARVAVPTFRRDLGLRLSVR